MADAWLPGTGRLHASTDGGELRGGAPRVVWQTLETDPRLVSALSAAQCLDQLGRAPHLVWNPLSGDIIQLIPVLRAGRSLGGPDYPISADATCHGEPAPVNREGRLCIQIAVVSFANEPFTAGPMIDLELLVWWLDTWRIPRSWPAGPPAAFPGALRAPRSRRLWACGGHFGGSQVPGCVATGPGDIEINRLTDPATIPTIKLPRRPREVTLPRRAMTAALGALQFRHHQQGDSEARLTTAG